jgi:hypothetical protein
MLQLVLFLALLATPGGKGQNFAPSVNQKLFNNYV